MVFIDGGEHGLKVVTVTLRWHQFALRTHCLSGNRVDGKGVLTKHRIQPWSQVGTCDQVENVVGTIAQGDLINLHTTACSQAAFQLKTIAIGVTGKLGQLGTNRL